jgi:hypothetical protein
MSITGLRNVLLMDPWSRSWIWARTLPMLGCGCCGPGGEGMVEVSESVPVPEVERVLGIDGLPGGFVFLEMVVCPEALLAVVAVGFLGGISRRKDSGHDAKKSGGGKEPAKARARRVRSQRCEESGGGKAGQKPEREEVGHVTARRVKKSEGFVSRVAKRRSDGPKKDRLCVAPAPPI